MNVISGFICFQEARCAYVLIIMAVYWVTEVLPIPVTALIPVVMFPLLNVVPSKVITKAYINVQLYFYCQIY